MYYFPQLSSGALVQFPHAVRRSTRTVINESADGSISAIGDAYAERVSWTLEYAGLSDAEAAALETLFTAVQGQRNTFVFVDPNSNLLQWSEDLTKDAWSCDPLLTVTAGGGASMLSAASFLVANTSQAQQGIAQVLAAPGRMHYCFSFYARAATPVEVIAERRTTADSETAMFRAASTWQRFRTAGRIEGASDEVHFSVRVPPAASIELAGVQAEAHPTASAYKPTYSQGGLYSNARFADDELRITTHGVNNHSTIIRLTANVRRT